MKSHLNRRLTNLRLSMATVESVPQLVMLGALSGIIAGLVIVAFRILIEHTQMSFLPGADAENYEALSPMMRILLATAGGLVVGLLFQYIAKSAGQVGVVHTMERLAYHQGRLPLRNAIWQFIGGATTIISGHSVGREGPSVHLGAASGSLLGQWMQLPNSSTRTLVACGVAAAIAASFNTPLAGVIFAMEVVLMEYTIAGFIPVIMAAVLATIVCHWFFGAETAFIVPDTGFATIAELPFVLILGLVIGVLAAVFIELLQRFSRISAPFPLWQRTTMAGFIIGICALATPQIMGIGYDTVNAAMLGEIAIGMLIAITLVKIVATTVGLGLGLPGGLIGPTLVIGATAGGVIGIIADLLFPGSISSPGFYAIIGMGAMMGATLHAPLAALIAMLELTANPSIILPGMLAIVMADLINCHLFGKPSVFVMLIKERGLDFHDSALAQTLRRIAVANVMERAVVTAAQQITAAEANAILKESPSWIVISYGNHQHSLLPAADLAQYLLAETEAVSGMVDLLDIPATRLDAYTIHLQASLQEAHEMIFAAGCEALCVMHNGVDEEQIVGVITQEMIETHYQS
ncbi:MAG TPA: chloride channel protein [Chromatiales bacterium]|nr:chloride channel protein [Chromatiales bacterium]